MKCWVICLQVKVHGLVGDVQVSKLADSHIQPGRKFVCDIFSKGSEIMNEGLIALVEPRRVLDYKREITQDSCGVDLISEILHNKDQLFGDVLQADVAPLDLIDCLGQIMEEEGVVHLGLVFTMEILQVILCSDVRYAARSHIEKMPGKVEYVLGDILRGVVPRQ